ncbi:hypothetical protein VNO77_44061 [Canavalia gladiata]|uniref:Uncharacterized protein n=1 Tax=Canavalia gladiata TaxID=3824 RepID=A0AAN9PNG2_CANGL
MESQSRSEFFSTTLRRETHLDFASAKSQITSQPLIQIKKTQFETSEAVRFVTAKNTRIVIYIHPIIPQHVHQHAIYSPSTPNVENLFILFFKIQPASLSCRRREQSPLSRPRFKYCSPRLNVLTYDFIESQCLLVVYGVS